MSCLPGFRKLFVSVGSSASPGVFPPCLRRQVETVASNCAYVGGHSDAAKRPKALQSTPPYLRPHCVQMTTCQEPLRIQMRLQFTTALAPWTRTRLGFARNFDGCAARFSVRKARSPVGNDETCGGEMKQATFLSCTTPNRMFQLHQGYLSHASCFALGILPETRGVVSSVCIVRVGVVEAVDAA